MAAHYGQAESYSSRRSSLDYSLPSSAPPNPSHRRTNDRAGHESPSSSHSISSLSSTGTAYSPLFNSGLENLRTAPTEVVTTDTGGRGWGGKVSKFSIGLKEIKEKGRTYLPSPPSSPYDSPISTFFSTSPRSLHPPPLRQVSAMGYLHPESVRSGRSRSGSVRSGASGDETAKSDGGREGSRGTESKAARVLGVKRGEVVLSGKAARLLGMENTAVGGGAMGMERRKRSEEEYSEYLEQRRPSIPPRTTSFAHQQPPPLHRSKLPQYPSTTHYHTSPAPPPPRATNQRLQRPPSPPFSSPPRPSSPPYSLSNDPISSDPTRLSYTGSLNLGLAAFKEVTQRELRRQRGQSDWTISTSPPTSSRTLRSTFAPFQGIPASEIYPVPPLPPSLRPSRNPSPRTSPGPPLSRQNRPTRTNTVTSGVSSASSGTRRYQRSNTLDALEGRRRAPRKTAPAKDERESKPFFDWSDDDVLPSDPPRPPSPQPLTVTSPTDPFFPPPSPHPYSRAGDRSSVFSSESRRSSWGEGMVDLFPRPPGEGEERRREGRGRKLSWLGGGRNSREGSFLEVKG